MDTRSDGFEELVRDLTPFLFRVLTPWAFSRETVEDLVQDVWLKVYRGLSRFQGRSDIRTWIYRIAVNTAARRFRRQAKEAVPVEAEWTDRRDALDPAKIVERRLLRRHVAAALGHLRPAEREIFVLRAWEEMPFVEIARWVGSTEGSVRVRYFKAVRKMRKSLQRLEEVSHAG